MNLFKKIMLSILFSSIFLTLAGCNSGLNPDKLEVVLDTELVSGMYDRMEGIVVVRSIDSDPITVTNISVNNGNCSYRAKFQQEKKFPVTLSMGQFTKIYLKCPYDSVVKVDVETDQGNAEYSFK